MFFRICFLLFFTYGCLAPAKVDDTANTGGRGPVSNSNQDEALVDGGTNNGNNENASFDSGHEAPEATPAMGEEGGPCYGNGTCNEGLLCNTNTNTCVESAPCANDNDCAGGFCDLSKGQCVECLTTSHCETGICSGGFCIQSATCSNDAECGDQFCNSQGNCVECYENSHCDSGVCNLQTFVCIPGCNDTDATEPNNDAMSTSTPVLDSGSTHAGSVCPGNVDYFKVSAEGSVEIHLTYNRAAGQLTLRLLDDTATHAPVASGANSNTGLSLNQSGLSGDYYIEVAGVNLLTDVPYQLTAVIDNGEDACVVIDEDDVTNNTHATGTLITPDGLTRAGSICGEDNDWYRLQLDAGTNLHAQALLTTEQVELTLYGPGNCPVTTNGEEIADCSSNQTFLNVVKGNPITVGNLATTGMYSILVTSKLNEDTTYQLKVVADSTQVDNCVQVDTEPNGSALLAMPITPGAPAITGSLCDIGPSSPDIDYYTFTANEMDDASIEVITISGDAVTHQVMAGDSTSPLTSLTNLEAGTYYIAVLQGLGGTSGSAYTIQVSLTPEPGVDPCSEEDLTEPVAVAADGTPYSGVVCTGDVDTFELTVSEQGTASLDVTFGHDQADINIEVRNASHQVVASASSTTDNEHVEWGAVAGTYTVTLTATAVNAEYANYTLLGTLNDCQEDDFEPNDTTETAQPLSNSTVEGVRCSGDDDYYNLNLVQDDLLAVTVTASASDLSLSLVDGTSAVIQSGTASDTTYTLNYTALTSGTYYLRVSGSNTDRTTYTLTSTITSTGCVDDGAEPNDSLSEGTPINTSDIATGQASFNDMTICADIDDSWLDYYTFELTEAKQLSVTFTTATADSDIILAIYEVTDANFYGIHELLYVYPVVNGTETISGFLNDKGTYAFRVLNLSNDVDTQYSLDFQFTDRASSGCTNDRFDSFTSSSDAANAPNNNTASKAVSLSAETPWTIDMADMQICGGDADWFKLNPGADETITINVDYTYTDLFTDDVDLALFINAAEDACPGSIDDDTGLCNVAESISVDDDESLSYLVPESYQTYYVRVIGFNQSENDYDISISVQ